MSMPEEPIIPSESFPPPHEDLSSPQRGRRRRVTRRQMIPADAEGQAALIASLARRAYPSIELFILSLACGAILGLGFMQDSPAVLLVGILLAPLMTHWVGFLLAIFTGSLRFLFETSMALLISIILVFIGGVLTGFVERLYLPETLTYLYGNAKLWAPTLIVVVIGAVTLVASFIRAESKPFLPSIIIAYGFFMPVSAAGFGLGSGLPELWPFGLQVLLFHFALASLFGIVTLFAMRIRPTTTLGYVFSGITLLIFVIISIQFIVVKFMPKPQADLPAFTPTNQQSAPPTITPNLTPASTNTTFVSATPNVISEFTSTPLIETTTPTVTTENTATPLSVTPVPLTLNVTLPVTETPTITLTIEIQSITGRISADEGGGANLRQTPNGKYLMTLDNGTIVEIYPDFKTVNGVTWVHVFVTRNGLRVEGWLLESVVSYATPEPNFGPSSTPNP